MLHHLFSLTLVAVLPLLSPVLAENTPTSVNLRIEGSAKTIFEGPVVTFGHNVTTASGGTHICDGTNNDANPTPGPTCISALDDAAKKNSFTFDGIFSSQLDDFLITSIGGEAQTPEEFWGILVDFKSIPPGGCQQEVEVNDDILFAFNAANAEHFLKLTGPGFAHVGQSIILTVTDAQTGSAVAGADVKGQTSDANGHVSVTFTEVGTKEVKATKSDSIRSSKFTIQVLP